MIIGSSISHYRIVEKLGEGGMGVVYKAEDTTLERTVALKFLAQHLLNDDEAKERFLREAKAAAALDHPNICTVHEIAKADGKTFIAMSFLEGAALEDRISEGPLSLKEALDIARQVADGLQAAHAKGVFHRDIKPANIIISPEGRATIMDFGLARLTEASRLTKVDTAMGTVAYMSPEQAQGMEVDGRTDIWALGCVLYEMVSGQRPFQGQYDQALLYEIVHEEPAALTGLRTGVPVELEFVVGKCLTKNHDDRPESAKEVAKELRTLAEKLKSGRSTILRTGQMSGAVPAMMTAAHTVNPAEALPPGTAPVRQSTYRALQGFTVAAALVAGALAFVLFTQAPPEESVTRFSFAPEGLNGAGISPDGKYILYGAQADGESSLWLRPLGDESARQLAGTERVIGAFWSPDSTWIGFAAGDELKKVSIDGGSSLPLGALPSQSDRFFSGTWSPDGERMIFSSGGRLYEIAARGGEAQLLFEPVDGPRPISLYPHYLPATGGPPAVVYTAATSNYVQSLAVMNLETGERRVLGPGSAAFYSNDGYLIRGAQLGSEPGLWALPFSRETLEASGQEIPIATVGELASVSGDGTLAFLDQVPIGSQQRQLVWRNRAGQVQQMAGKPQLQLREFSISPDGRRVATTAGDNYHADVWILDLARSTTTRVTFGDRSEFQPSWSPSGKELIYVGVGEIAGSRSLNRTATDGTDQPTALLELEGLNGPNWSRDGKYLIFMQGEQNGTEGDIYYIDLSAQADSRKKIAYLAGPSGQAAPMFSPDGRFVAYVSDESGRNQVYIQPFPSGSGRLQASVNGGTQPRWRADGRELFFVEGNSALTAVSVSTGGADLRLGQPQQLFESEDFVPYPWPSYDVSADGQRFLTSAPVEDGEEDAPPKIRIVQNWYEEFRDREQ